jgi:hypothetical protein
MLYIWLKLIRIRLRLGRPGCGSGKMMPDDDPDPQHFSIGSSVARTLNYLQIRDLEAELDEERKQRQAAVNAKKKLETDYKGLC